MTAAERALAVARARALYRARMDAADRWIEHVWGITQCRPKGTE